MSYGWLDFSGEHYRRCRSAWVFLLLFDATGTLLAHDCAILVSTKRGISGCTYLNGYLEVPGDEYTWRRLTLEETPSQKHRENCR